jgi:hypothetical protein
VRRTALLAGLLALAGALLRRARSGRDDADVWTRATSAPDLR